MAAPKGNTYAVGNSGKGKLFSSVQELQDAIDDYFEKCDNNTKPVVTKDGVVYVEDPIPYTVEGLAELLEVTRVGLLNYEKGEGYEEYFSTVKKAKAKIQRNKLERALSGKAPSTFAIFDLVNNSDYVNTNHTDVTSAGEKLQPTTIVFRKYTDE